MYDESLDWEDALRRALDDRLGRHPRPDGPALAKTLFKAAAEAPREMRIAVLEERYEELKLDLGSARARCGEGAAQNVLRDMAACDAAKRLLLR